MAILNIQEMEIGVAGVDPSIILILTNDTSTTVTTTGYLTAAKKQGYQFSNTQMALVYTTDMHASWYALSVSLAGVVSLIPEVNPGSVTLPVVANDFVMFNGTGGLLKDTGISPSNPGKTKVVMATAATTANLIPKFTDTAGTIGNGYTPSDTAKTVAVMAAAATTANLIPKFTDIAGTIGNGYTPSDTAKTVAVMAAAATTANLIPKFTDIAGTIGNGYTPSDTAKTVVVMADASTTAGRVPTFVDAAGTIGNGYLVYNNLLATTISVPDTNVNMVSFDITVGFAALAAGASVTLHASSAAKQFKIRALWINAGGTNFSGGGGDRLLSITDDTTVYSLIPAASLGTLINDGWGDGAGLPYPAAAAINVSTAAGASLVAKYSGGAADYTAGSVVISGLLQRVA